MGDLRVLVADDNHDIVLTLTALLRDEGYEVEGVERSVDVVAATRRFKPDAILLDLEMPGMSGYAVARELRRIEGADGPVLIAITGKWSSPSDRLLAREIGFDHHLTKPVEPERLFELLRSCRAGAS